MHFLIIWQHERIIDTAAGLCGFFLQWEWEQLAFISESDQRHRGRDYPTPGWDGYPKAPRKESRSINRHLGDRMQEINKPLLLRKVKKSRASTFRTQKIEDISDQ